MEKNNPINSVYLIALALASMILFVNTLMEGVVFAVCIIATFLIGISIVSMIEKIADKHIRFLIYALVCTAVITALKISAVYIDSQLIISSMKNIDIAIVPCLLLAIVPIYFEETFSVKQYFGNSFLICFGFALMLCVYTSIIEVAAFGQILGKDLGFAGLDFFAMPYGKFMVIACLAILFNMVRRAHIKKTKRFRTLVEQYKVQIREIQDTAVRAERAKTKEGGDK